MIVREWRARASVEGAPRYRQHFTAVVVPMLREVDGFIAATLMSRAVDGVVEIVVLTRWLSMDSVRDFATTGVDNAVVEPAIARTLLSYDDGVQHYDVEEEASCASGEQHVPEQDSSIPPRMISRSPFP